MNTNTNLPLKDGATDSAESRSITTRARATVTALVDELVASLGRVRAGARGGHSRTETPAGEKPDGQPDPLAYNGADAARQNSINDDGAAQLLTDRDDQSADPDDQGPADVDAELLNWSCNGRRLSEVGGRMVVPVTEDPRQQGDIDAIQTVSGDLLLSGDTGAWIQSDYSVTLEGGQ